MIHHVSRRLACLEPFMIHNTGPRPFSQDKQVFVHQLERQGPLSEEGQKPKTPSTIEKGHY